MRKWRNWQTRRLQVPVVAIPCGFKSHLLHRRDTISDLAYRIFLYLKRCGRYAKLRGSCADSGKWGLCGMKTRSRSVSLAAVLSFQPRSGSYRLAAASPAQLQAKDRRLPKVCCYSGSSSAIFRYVVSEFRFSDPETILSYAIIYIKAIIY